MITAVRLRERDKKAGFLMRTYFSAFSRSKYTAGEHGQPSPFRLVKSQGEIDELSRFPQFEILDFDDMDQLNEFVQQEMEDRARKGLPAVRAAIMGGAGAPLAQKKVTPRRRSAHDRLPPAASGAPSDPGRTNTGRRPAQVPPKEKDEPVQPKTVTPVSKPKPKPKADPKPKPKAKPKAKPKTAGKTKKQLLAMAKKMDLDISARAKKADIEEAIQNASR